MGLPGAAGAAGRPVRPLGRDLEGAGAVRFAAPGAAAEATLVQQGAFGVAHLNLDNTIAAGVPWMVRYEGSKGVRLVYRVSGSDAVMRHPVHPAEMTAPSRSWTTAWSARCRTPTARSSSRWPARPSSASRPAPAALVSSRARGRRPAAAVARRGSAGGSPPRGRPRSCRAWGGGRPRAGGRRSRASSRTGASAGSGSVVNTSSTAPAMRRSRTAATRSASTTRSPRPKFSTQAPGFRRASAALSMMPARLGRRGQQQEQVVGLGEHAGGLGRRVHALDVRDRRRLALGADHAHVERGGQPRHLDADRAEPEDAERGAGQRGIDASAPPALPPDRARCRPDPWRTGRARPGCARTSARDACRARR